MRLLPPNATVLERRIADAAGIDLPVGIADLWNPHTCPENALPWLAWALHMTDAEGWRLAVTVSQRRALLARSVELHRKKGTPYGIRQALQTVGFNDVQILERLPSNRHDASLGYDGAVRHDAYGWAEFRLVAEAGDTQPVSAQQTARIIETVHEWKPARCHLVDIQHRVSTSDDVEVVDETSMAGALAADDVFAWGRAYDGSLTHSQGALHDYAGVRLHDGSIAYIPYHAAGVRHDAVRESSAMSADMTLADIQARVSRFDGNTDHAGVVDYGHAAPCAEDAPMPITVTRHLRHDGRVRYADLMFNGSRWHDATATYAGNVSHRGDIQTYLEA